MKTETLNAVRMFLKDYALSNNNNDINKNNFISRG